MDNLNNYYDQKLKLDRLKILKKSKNFKFLKVDLRNRNKLFTIFDKFKFKKVINLAAQAGVRNSIKNPSDYTRSNLVGFANILENCREHKIEHLVYASTSSVYGANTKKPFSEHDSANHPLSVYAASKVYVKYFTEALRVELESFGISVSLLQPGATPTNDVVKNHAQLFASFDTLQYLLHLHHLNCR